LQLLAAALAFVDPLTGAQREFKSSLRLRFSENVTESTMDNSR